MVEAYFYKISTFAIEVLLDITILPVMPIGTILKSDLDYNCRFGC